MQREKDKNEPAKDHLYSVKTNKSSDPFGMADGLLFVTGLPFAHRGSPFRSAKAATLAATASCRIYHPARPTWKFTSGPAQTKAGGPLDGSSPFPRHCQ